VYAALRAKQLRQRPERPSHFTANKRIQYETKRYQKQHTTARLSYAYRADNRQCVNAIASTAESDTGLPGTGSL
jgi:hypothetical protein